MDKTDFLAKSDKITSVFSPLPPGEGAGVRAGRQLRFFAKTDITETHYHDQSYPNDLEQFGRTLACWHEPGTFTFHVDVGERRPVVEPGSVVPRVEINRVERWSDTQSLGCLSKRCLANASDTGLVARTRHGTGWVARTSLRRLSRSPGRCNCLLASGAEELSEQAFSSECQSGIARRDLWYHGCGR